MKKSEIRDNLVSVRVSTENVYLLGRISGILSALSGQVFESFDYARYEEIDPENGEKYQIFSAKATDSQMAMIVFTLMRMYEKEIVNIDCRKVVE